MKKAILTRTETSDEGTFGTLLTDSGFTCRTGELPWRDLNGDGVSDLGASCIPPGKYLCIWRDSPKFGPCYHVEDVPGRTKILIHSANFMGDKSKGFRCQLEGCIAPGLAVKVLNGQKGVSSSREALSRLESDLGLEPFELTIEDVG
jgi:hypothetical protein